MLDWNSIETVLLDMDGTLLDLHFDNYFWLEHLPKRYAETKALDYADAHKHLMQHFESQRGHLNWYCLDYWSEQLGLDVADLKLEVEHLIQFHPHVEDFLAELQEGEKRVILVTNAHRKSLQLKEKHTQLQQYFDRVVSSHDFNLAKENTKFWLELQKIEPYNPETTLLIDDSIPVLRSAQAFGIRHLLTIIQPDSKKARREENQTEGFKALTHFQQIQPSKMQKE